MSNIKGFFLNGRDNPYANYKRLVVIFLTGRGEALLVYLKSGDESLPLSKKGTKATQRHLTSKFDGSSDIYQTSFNAVQAFT